MVIKAEAKAVGMDSLSLRKNLGQTRRIVLAGLVLVGVSTVTIASSNISRTSKALLQLRALGSRARKARPKAAKQVRVLTQTKTL